MNIGIETAADGRSATLVLAKLPIGSVAAQDEAWTWCTASGEHGEASTLAAALARCEAAYWHGETLRLKTCIETMEQAAFTIAPYLHYTIGSDSPSYHPTMPSAVAVFETAFPRARARERMRERMNALVA